MLKVMMAQVATAERGTRTAMMMAQSPKPLIHMLPWVVHLVVT
jgi:hypothetical protein